MNEVGKKKDESRKKRIKEKRRKITNISDYQTDLLLPLSLALPQSLGSVHGLEMISVITGGDVSDYWR